MPKAKTPKPDRPKYRIIARDAQGNPGGINYPPGDRRAEFGDVVDDLPAGDIPWMLAEGIIKPVVEGTG